MAVDTVIFRPELVTKIRAGEKSQTRRLVKPQEFVCRYKVEKDYAVQPGRGEKAACRIRVVATRREQLGRLTEQDARLEGFANRGAFERYWLELHDRHFHGHTHKLDAQAIAEHFTERHGEKPVWVITFEIVIYERHRVQQGRPLFLAAPSVQADYTSDPKKATLDAGEAVPPEEVEQFTLEALQRHAVAQAKSEQERYADMTIGERLDNALAEARERRIDTTSIERLAERQLAELERRKDRAA